MELEQLRQLDAIERCGTMSAAARELSISQPALSRSIQRLEAELGQSLFDRSGNRAEINAVGRVAVEHARAVLREERLLRDAVDEAARRPRALRVATCAPAPLWRLTELAVGELPDVLLQSETRSEEDVREQTLNGLADLGIVAHPVMLPTLSCTLLMTENLSVCVPEGHELAGRDYVSYHDLDGRDFLLLEDIGSWRDVVDSHIPNAHLVVQRDREVFQQLIRTTRMLYFVTDVRQNALDVPGRVTVPISDAAAHATFYLLARTDAAPQVRAVVEAVRDQG